MINYKTTNKRILKKHKYLRKFNFGFFNGTQICTDLNRFTRIFNSCVNSVLLCVLKIKPLRGFCFFGNDINYLPITKPSLFKRNITGRVEFDFLNH